MWLTNKPVLRWITLIEVIIAIYIFWVGILIILRILISNISRLADINSRDKAVSFAKEGMDIVFHLRDSNLERGMHRNCAIMSSTTQGKCDARFYESEQTYRTVNYVIDDLYSLEAIDTGDLEETTLRYHTWQIIGWMSWFWYTHDVDWWVATNYKRRITFTPHPDHDWETDKILTVHSIVRYMRGNQEKKVVLESNIGDMR